MIKQKENILKLNTVVKLQNTLPLIDAMAQQNYEV